MIKVKEIMNSNVIYCDPSATISSTAQLLKEHDISGVPVVKNNVVVGVVSEVDLLKLLELPKHGDLWLPSPFEVIEIPIRELISWEETKKMLTDIGSRPVSDIMKKDVSMISSEDSIEDASELMSRHKVHRLPVIDNGRLVGIVTRGDIIRGIASA